MQITQVATGNGLALIECVRELDSEGVAQWLAMPQTLVNVNMQDDEGMTPLHYAAAFGARPCIRLLVASQRCDYLVRDLKGRYAFELALEWSRDYAVARLLQKKQIAQAHAQGVPAYIPRGTPDRP